MSVRITELPEVTEHAASPHPPTDVERRRLFNKYSERVSVNPDLSRALVSYQANKQEPVYGWLNYREGFSAELVRYLLSTLTTDPGKLLDPFAGAGTALFAAQSLGWETVGIELLPVGAAFLRARVAAAQVQPETFRRAIQAFAEADWNTQHEGQWSFQHLRITTGAFPPANEQAIAAFRKYCHDKIDDPAVRRLFDFAGLCVLEEASYTRKDGQYLRWDCRAPRELLSRRFSKGKIDSFPEVVLRHLRRMLADLEGVDQGGQLTLRNLVEPSTGPAPQLIEDSCLEVLPRLRTADYDCILTSPPYCNRYDYTRTYALELAYLGYDDERVGALRQELLTCTVENREKTERLRALYGRVGRASLYRRAEAAFREQSALREVLRLLEESRRRGELNNPNIVRMVRNYFFEMSLVVFEFARLLRPGGLVVMVNDNVRYAGEEIPVDLILSEFASLAGLMVDRIWTLPTGKGNSSQQMGAHGRRELRKCVYVWRKPAAPRSIQERLNSIDGRTRIPQVPAQV